LTNDAGNRDEPWFQILDPARSRFVSKAAYDTILPGWRACLATDRVVGQRNATVLGTAHRSSPAATTFTDRFADADLTGSWILVLALLTPLLATPIAKTYLDKRRRMLDGMSEFAVAFVREFARPLPRRHPADRPIAVTLRCAPYRGRLEIRVAPSPGHSYPNLSDHRKNLSYDVERVLRLVPARSFVCREPYQQGSWVVIPFQADPVVTPQEGVM
jgi:hypothetical protein